MGGAVNDAHVIGKILAEQLPASSLWYGARGGDRQGGGYESAEESESSDEGRHHCVVQSLLTSLEGYYCTLQSYVAAPS